MIMDNQNQRPWTMPEYKGKLRPTMSVDFKDYASPTIDDMIGTTLELLIEDKITDEKANRLLNHYDLLKKAGHWTLPE